MFFWLILMMLLFDKVNIIKNYNINQNYIIIFRFNSIIKFKLKNFDFKLFKFDFIILRVF